MPTTIVRKYFDWVSGCEVKEENKVNEIFNVKKSLENQYDCTVLGSYISFIPILLQLEQFNYRFQRLDYTFVKGRNIGTELFSFQVQV